MADLNARSWKRQTEPRKAYRLWRSPLLGVQSSVRTSDADSASRVLRRRRYKPKHIGIGIRAFLRPEYCFIRIVQSPSETYRTLLFALGSFSLCYERSRFLLSGHSELKEMPLVQNDAHGNDRDGLSNRRIGGTVSTQPASMIHGVPCLLYGNAGFHSDASGFRPNSRACSQSVRR